MGGRAFICGPRISEIAAAASIGMNVLSGPHVCACHDPGNEGVTGVIVLSTSHCSIHIWDKADVPHARIDVYSCKKFEMCDVERMLDELNPSHYDYMLVDRNKAGPVTVGNGSFFAVANGGGEIVAKPGRSFLTTR